MASRLCKKIIPLAACLMTAGGCSTPIPGGVSELPSRADGLENIEFSREHRSWLDRPSEVSWIWAVTINGENVYRLGNGESVRFGLEPGQYSFGVRCEVGDLLFSSWVIKEITADITNSVDTVRFDVGKPLNAGGCFISKPPLGSVEGIENIEIIPTYRRKTFIPKREESIVYTDGMVFTVDGEDFTSVRGVRFGLEAGNHTIGVRCRTHEGQSELHYDEVAVTIKDNAPLLQLYAGKHNNLCYISEAAPQRNMDTQP